MSSLSPPKGVLQMLSVWRSPSYKVRHIKKIGYNSINIITKVPINGAQKATVAVQYITKNVVSVCVCVDVQKNTCTHGKPFLFNSQYTGVIRCFTKGAGIKMQRICITE